MALGVTANAIGVGGIPGILSIQTPFMASFAICMLIAFTVSFMLTIMVGKKRMQAEKAGEAVAQTENDIETEAMALEMRESTKESCMNELTAFLSGNAIPLSEVGDGVFSEGIMGDGMAIIPKNQTLYAPVDAEVAVLMPESKHACGLKLENGMEILLHIGIDTVAMNGDGFEYLVEEGQKVRAGTPLIVFDREKIKAAGHPDVTVCVVTEEGEAQDIQFYTGMEVKERETVIGSMK